jgi:hypothetical protein
MDKITQILENVVRCKYFEAGVHIKNPINNSYQDGLVRTTQTLDHVVVVHILIFETRESDNQVLFNLTGSSRFEFVICLLGQSICVLRVQVLLKV